MPAEHLEKIMNHIWQISETDPSFRQYAILDAARDDGIYAKLLETGMEHACLFRGAKAQDLATVAPYLVKLDREDPVTRWVLDRGWGNSWGIFVESATDHRALLRHFQSLVMIYDEDGKPLYFRYYDPRVLRVYLPTCNETELATVFGPVSSYYLEDEEPERMISYAFAQGELVERKIQLSP